MDIRKLLVVPAAVALSGLAGMTANADTLRLNDGRIIRGQLVSINRGVVLFDQDAGSNYSRTRRIRVSLDRVDGIDFTDQADQNDDSFGTYDRYGNDRYGNDRYGYGRQQDVVVRADQQWTDTGINVRAGDTLRFNASGTVLWGPGRQDGPEGEYNSPPNQRRPLPDRAGGALIGRIGSGTNDVFFIGNDRGTLRARTSGRLYLGINDDYLGDNSGNFRVVVDHQ